MPLRPARPLLAFALFAGFTASALAQVDAPSLAPQDGLPMNLPPLIESAPDRRTLPPVSPGSMIKTVLTLSALFHDGSPAISSGLKWRIFSDQADVNGNHALVFESEDSRPFITLDPGGYIIHVVYGLASATRHIVLGTEARDERIALDVGALRFSGAIGNTPIPSNELTFEIHKVGGLDEDLVAKVRAGEVLRLKAGSYQITSTFGEVNAKVISEINLESGKLMDASVLHKAGYVDLRLLAPTGNEVPDATWSILTPGGDVVSESLGQIRDLVLAEGEYVAVARFNDRNYQQNFNVESGKKTAVDVAAN